MSSLLAGLAVLAALTTGEPPGKQEIACELTPVLVGRFIGSRFERDEPGDANASTLRFVFRDIDPAQAVATMVFEGDRRQLSVAMTVEEGAITYLREEPNLGKLLIATQTKPTEQGWPAIMSQHSWTEAGGLRVRTATGMCRLRQRG